jgi:hypothetical protein
VRHYKFKPDAEAAETIEELRTKLSEVVGITVIGTRITLRWDGGFRKRLKEVSMLVVDVEDGGRLTECASCGCITDYNPDDVSLCGECECPK